MAELKSDLVESVRVRLLNRWHQGAGLLRRKLHQSGFLAAIIIVSLAATVARVPSALGDEPPKRIVSLNLCTDQLVMMLVGPERIAAVSHMALDPKLSVLADTAAGLPIIYGQAEEVYLLKPDLVVSGSFHLSASVEILRRLGVIVEEFPAANSFADIRVNVRRMGRLLGASEKAEALVAALDEKLNQISKERGQRAVLAALYYANSYTSGMDTLASEVVKLAGFDNLASKLGLSGTRELPLEVLVMERPDLVVTGASYTAPALAQEIFSHPALAYLERSTGRAGVEEKFWICGTPFSVEAVEALVAARGQLPARTAFVEGGPTDITANIGGAPQRAKRP